MKVENVASGCAVVAGGAGFLGSFVVDRLRQTDWCSEVFAPRSREYDLRDNSVVIPLFQDTRPDIVIHAAGIVGGMGANRERPSEFFYDNLIMGIQVTEQARLVGVQKFVAIGAICTYPKFTAVPFTEDNLWHDYQGHYLDPHRTTTSNSIPTLAYPDHDLSAFRLVRREARSCRATKPLRRLSAIARKLKRCRSACE